MISHYELIARIAAGAILGAVIGYERDRRQRPAGLRTHLLVAMSSATFMVVSEYFVLFQNYDHQDQIIKIDTSGIASGVVSGIGFLAGGVILRTGSSIQGLTTAAGLWLVTAIGLCTGAGMFIEGAAVTLMGVFSLTAMRRFEDKDDTTLLRKISLVFGERAPPLSQIVVSLQQLKATVSDISYDKRLDEKKISISFHVQIASDVSVDQVIETLEKQENIQRVQVELPE